MVVKLGQKAQRLDQSEIPTICAPLMQYETCRHETQGHARHLSGIVPLFGGSFPLSRGVSP